MSSARAGTSPALEAEALNGALPVVPGLDAYLHSLQASCNSYIVLQDLSSTSTTEAKSTAVLLSQRSECLDGIALIVLPGDPTSSLAVKMEALKKVTGGAVARRVVLKLSTPVEKLAEIRVVNILIVHSDGEPAPETLTARRGRAQAAWFPGPEFVCWW